MGVFKVVGIPKSLIFCHVVVVGALFYILPSMASSLCHLQVTYDILVFSFKKDVVAAPAVCRKRNESDIPMMKYSFLILKDSFILQAFDRGLAVNINNKDNWYVGSSNSFSQANPFRNKGEMHSLT